MSSQPPAPRVPVPPGLRTVFMLWLPLAFSFELMWLEGPAVQSAVSRLADPTLNLAAWGLTMSLSLLIESPVIMLLVTSIALARDGQSFRILRRFTLILCGIGTVVTAAVAFTPLFDLVTRGVMGLPEPLANAARPALRIMLLWTAAIGWRRFYQGVLVRHGRTRLVSLGTFVRLLVVLGTALSLLRAGVLPGVELAATTLMAAVITEALVTTAFAWPVVAREVLPRVREEVPALSLAAVARFHLPLALTTLLTLTTQPLTAAALARLPHPETMLAAWPVTFSTLMVIGGCGFALQEITVAQGGDPGARPVLRRFAWILGVATSLVLLALVHTPVLGFWLESVIHAPGTLHAEIRSGVLCGVFYPLLTALLLWRRGLLVSAGATGDVYRCMSLGLLSLVALLGGAVLAQVPGVVAGAGAFTGASLVEFLALRRKARARGLG